MFKEIREKILGKPVDEPEKLETAAPIVMYTTRFCGYCMRARSLLEHKGWKYQEIPVDGNPELRAEMSERSGRRTVPQIWIGDEHVGGCDELFRLEADNRLETMVMGEAK